MHDNKHLQFQLAPEPLIKEAAHLHGLVENVIASLWASLKSLHCSQCGEAFTLLCWDPQDIERWEMVCGTCEDMELLRIEVGLAWPSQEESDDLQG
jgi:hypothetical protein